MAKNNSIDLAMQLYKEILSNPEASAERKDQAAYRLAHIARTRAIQRRDVRVKRLAAKLDKALASIAELETQLAYKPQVFTSLRDMAAAESNDSGRK